MSIPVVLNGVTYIIPETGETDWGYETTAYLVALAPLVNSIAVGSGGSTGAGIVPTLVTKLWSFKNASGEPTYSSVVGPVMLGEANEVPCVVFVSSDWNTYALRISDGSVLWSYTGPDMCYGRCQWATIGGNNYVFSPCHAGGINKLDRNGVRVGGYPSIYDDPNRNSGTITAVTTVGVDTYEITSDKSGWVVGNMFQRPNPPNDNAAVELLNGAVSLAFGTVLQVLAPNQMRLVLDAGSAPPLIGNSYKILPRYWSDVVFMHAGTLSNESGVQYLYLTSFDNCIRKVRASDMVEIWIKASLENIEPYPMLIEIGGSLKCFAVSIDKHVYCLDASNGNVLWATDCCPRQGEGLDAFLNACNLHGNGALKLSVSSRDGRVYIVDAVSGARELESTDTQAWQFDEINSSAIPIKLPGAGTYRIVTGGDAGTAWCFDHNMNTVWNNFVVPNSINSSSIIHDILGDGAPCQLVGDMRGTLHVIRIIDGVRLGSLYFKGGIEGVPYYGDVDGDGKVEMVVTTTDGYTEMFRFEHGGLLNDPTVFPGNTRFTGNATRVI